MSALEVFGKKSMRIAKNYTKGYSETQLKVRNATSNDPWAATSKELDEIAQLSHNQNDFAEIVEILEKRLNDKGKNWRHVHKSLTVVEHILLQGPDSAITYFRENNHLIRTLREFQHVDDKGVDQGVNVRQKAKDITGSLSDIPSLQAKRTARTAMRLAGSSDSARSRERRLVGADSRAQANAGDEEDEDARRREDALLRSVLSNSRGVDGRVPDDEDPDLQRAIEESHRLLVEETSGTHMTVEEMDILRAIQLSEQTAAEEASKRVEPTPFDGVRFLEGSSTSPPIPVQSPPPENPFLLVDTSIPEDSVSPQLQYTSYQPQTDVMQLLHRAANVANSPYGLATQPAWFLPNETVQNPGVTHTPEPLALTMSIPPSTSPVTQPHSPTFGSNNPFAPNFRPSSPSPVSDLSTPPLSRFSPPPQSPSSPITPQYLHDSSQHPKLNVDTTEFDKLFAGGVNGDEGVDTYGNIGQLRYGTSSQAPNPATYNPFLRP